jgi:hypothetical protein
MSSPAGRPLVPCLETIAAVRSAKNRSGGEGCLALRKQLVSRDKLLSAPTDATFATS